MSKYLGTFKVKDGDQDTSNKLMSLYMIRSSFIVISIDSWLVYENKYLDNCAYKISNKRMTDYIDNNRFED